MNILEKIEGWVIPNTSRQITAVKMREILTDIANAITSAGAVASEKHIETWVNAPNYEVSIEHTLNSNLIDVHIYLVSGDNREKIPTADYTVFCEESGVVRITKTVTGFWNNAEVVLIKVY